MRGYRGRPAETAAAIDAEGWLHTGDIAAQAADGYLRIIDRKKDLVITAGGENVSPAAVELAIRTACPLIAQAVVVGDNRPYLVALLVLEPGAPAAVDAEQIAAAITEANATLSRAEQVRAFTVVTGQWAPGGELLTATMKVRRRPVLQAYAAQIEALYSPAEHSGRSE
jgi:long-chain acyl-CoA synthetase